VIYTVILKPLTPQNIVIGGARARCRRCWAGPRCAASRPGALILFLIIFLWTPPHFWALALYRVEDYRKSGLPMLPVTHGNEFTRCRSCCTPSCCSRPADAFAYGMSSWLYLAAALVLSAGFTWYGSSCGATTRTRWRARPSASP
jgi:protoheme IX farnesyltransferase